MTTWIARGGLPIILITFGYTFFSLRLGAMSDPSSLLGHMLGVLGFILMLMTETLVTDLKEDAEDEDAIEGSVR